MNVYCQPCDKNMSVNNLFTHVEGKTHKTRLFQESFDQKLSRSVVVRGISQHLSRENVQDIFVTFGKVESYHFPSKSRDTAIVRFFNVQTTRTVLQESKNINYRGHKLHISDALSPLHEKPACPPPPKISRRIPTHVHDVDSMFIEQQNMYSQDWKSTIPESNYKESRNVDRSIKPDLRDKARISELDERYQQFRKMLENESRTNDPLREQKMLEPHLHRPDHGILKTESRFSNLDMRNQPVLDSFSQRNLKESKVDYRFQNTETSRNYTLSDSQNRASNHEQHITPLYKSQESDGREMAAESISHLPTLSKYIPSFTLRNTVGRNEMTSETPFLRQDIDDRTLDRRSRDLDNGGGSSIFKRDLISDYKNQNPDSRIHSSNLHYQNIRRSSSDRNRRSRSRDTGKRTQENQYQGREKKRSMMEPQDKNPKSDYRSRDRANSPNRKSSYPKADQSSSKSDFQAHSSASRMNERDSGRECRARTPSISDRSADRNISKSRRNSEIDDSKSTLKFITSLDFKGDFNQQLSILMSKTRRFAFDPQNLGLIYADILRVLQYDFEGSRIHPCGAAVTDLALPDSQVHCYAELTEANKNKLKSTSMHDNLTDKAAKTFYETIKLHRKFFSDSRAFIHRKNSFVLVKHIPTGYYANISFKGGFKVARSELIKLFLSTDERLKTFFSFISYWSTVNGVLVKNDFSKYCLSLLVIFYLQRLAKPILPPVQFLQNDSSYDLFEDGWNRGFNKTLHKIPKNENTTDIMTLLEGFFEFYGNFAFEDFVISPFIGLAIPLNIFQNLESLPLCFGNYVDRIKGKLVKPLPINGAMNIQDSFQLNYNISNNVTTQMKKNFQTKCQDSFCQFQKCRRKHTYDGLLSTILNINKKHSDEKKIFKIIVTLPVKQSDALSEECTMLIFVRLNKLLTDAVTNVLKCKFTCLKDVKYDDKGSLISPHVKYTCTAYYNLWSSRISKKGSFISSSMEDEALVSDKIIDCLYRNQKPNCPILVFTLEASIKLEAKFIQLNMSCEDAYSETFREFIDSIGPILEDSVRKLVMCI